MEATRPVKVEYRAWAFTRAWLLFAGDKPPGKHPCVSAVQPATGLVLNIADATLSKPDIPRFSWTGGCVLTSCWLEKRK